MGMKPLSPEEKAERVAAQRASARQAVADYQDERDRIEANSQRLKALRLAREAEQASADNIETSNVTKPAKRRRSTS